jgi:hypothetical protein
MLFSRQGALNSPSRKGQSVPSVEFVLALLAYGFSSIGSGSTDTECFTETTLAAYAQTLKDNGEGAKAQLYKTARNLCTRLLAREISVREALNVLEEKRKHLAGK